jgi:hypothetical protein
MQRVTVAERRIYACDHCTVAWIPEDGTLVRLSSSNNETRGRPDAPPTSETLDVLEVIVESVAQDLLD